MSHLDDRYTTVDPVVLYMIKTRRTLGEGYPGFGEIHRVAEFLMGHPIWTHEFAERALWDKLAQLIDNQVYGIPGEFDVETWPETVVVMRQVLGDEVVIHRGVEQRSESPLASLERIAPGKPKIVLVQEDVE